MKSLLYPEFLLQVMGVPTVIQGKWMAIGVLYEIHGGDPFFQSPKFVCRLTFVILVVRYYPGASLNRSDKMLNHG